MPLLLGVALSLVAPTVALPAVSGEDWWWVAGDSRDADAVFVDARTARRQGDTASITAVRIARDGTAAEASWQGRCSDHHADDDIAAIARFACGTDDDRMQNAALLGGLTPEEAARAIFRVRPARPDRAQLRVS